MSELEELRALLAETSDPHKQTVLIARIRKLEKESGVKPPQPTSEDRLANWREKERDIADGTVSMENIRKIMANPTS